jgi:hypothetical protein
VDPYTVEVGDGELGIVFAVGDALGGVAPARGYVRA